jgi:hypothetical protein
MTHCRLAQVKELDCWRFDEPCDSTIRSQPFDISQATERHGDKARHDKAQFDTFRREKTINIFVVLLKAT